MPPPSMMITTIENNQEIKKLFNLLSLEVTIRLANHKRWCMPKIRINRNIKIGSRRMKMKYLFCINFRDGKLCCPMVSIIRRITTITITDNPVNINRTNEINIIDIIEYLWPF